MSTFFIVVVVTIVAALLGLWAYRRATTPASAPSGKSKIGNQGEQWGVRIAAPAPERACPQVREMLGKEFPISEKPPLPLLDCPFRTSANADISSSLTAAKVSAARAPTEDWRVSASRRKHPAVPAKTDAKKLTGTNAGRV